MMEIQGQSDAKTNYLLEIGKVIMQVPILITNMLGAPPKASNIKTQIGGERRR